MTSTEYSSCKIAGKRTGRVFLAMTSIFLLVFLCWSALFDLDEISTGQGRIVPSSREQLIQSLDSGVLSEMLVHEGQHVEKGQVLVRIDDAMSFALYSEAREKVLALSGQAARLSAEAYGLSLQFPDILSNRPDITERERQAFSVRQKARDDQIAAMTQMIATVTREIVIVAPMVRQRSVSEVELLRLQRTEAEYKGQLAERRNRYLTEAHNELLRVESDLSQSKEIARAREDSFKRTVLTSPVRGIVKSVLINTVGGVIPSGQNILEVVPVDEETIVEAYVKPSDIAFLKVGQHAEVKLTAYDYNRYGGLSAVLVHLSPDAIRSESRAAKNGAAPVDFDTSFYRILLKVTDARLLRQGKLIELVPGMTVSVDIQTGKKTVLEYLIGPIHSLKGSLRER